MMLLYIFQRRGPVPTIVHAFDGSLPTMVEMVLERAGVQPLDRDQVSQTLELLALELHMTGAEDIEADAVPYVLRKPELADTWRTLVSNQTPAFLSRYLGTTGWLVRFASGSIQDYYLARMLARAANGTTIEGFPEVGQLFNMLSEPAWIRPVRLFSAMDETFRAAWKQWKSMEGETDPILFFAVKLGFLELAWILVRFGICPQVRWKMSVESMAWYEEGSPLWFAAWYGHARLVQLFVDVKCDVDDVGRTWGKCGSPLWIASWRGHDEVVKVLLAVSADHRSHGQWMGESGSPLWIASRKGHDGVCRLLLESGAEPEGDMEFLRRAGSRSRSCAATSPVRRGPPSDARSACMSPARSATPDLQPPSPLKETRDIRLLTPPRETSPPLPVMSARQQRIADSWRSRPPSRHTSSPRTPAPQQTGERYTPTPSSARVRNVYRMGGVRSSDRKRQQASPATSVRNAAQREAVPDVPRLVPVATLNRVVTGKRYDKAWENHQSVLKELPLQPWDQVDKDVLAPTAVDSSRSRTAQLLKRGDALKKRLQALPELAPPRARYAA
mmetsp:Transcript_25191/g.64452  ORF Transcript_25191/g.64452 Transcript_25191/m.64452 type:complete len:558 (+) Transcript_25191:244-1917(+)